MLALVQAVEGMVRSKERKGMLRGKDWKESTVGVKAIVYVKENRGAVRRERRS